MSLLHRLPLEQIDARQFTFLLFFLLNFTGCKSAPSEESKSSREVIETATRSKLTFELLPVNSRQRLVVQRSTYSDGLVVETLAGVVLHAAEDLKIILLEDFIPTPTRGSRDLKPETAKQKEPEPVRVRISLPNKPFQGVKMKPTLQFLETSGYHQFKENFETYVPSCEKGDALGLAYVSNDSLVRRKNVVSLNDKEHEPGTNQTYFAIGNIVCIKIQEINE
jgi:hypothetical protein